MFFTPKDRKDLFHTLNNFVVFIKWILSLAIVVHNEARAIENLSHLSLKKKPSKLLILGFREISNPLPVNPVPRIFPCNSFSIFFIF